MLAPSGVGLNSLRSDNGRSDPLAAALLSPVTRQDYKYQIPNTETVFPSGQTLLHTGKSAPDCRRHALASSAGLDG